jgi:hypothetical protein
MANIDQITIRRFGSQVSPYDHEKANEPIDDLASVIAIVNAESSSNHEVLEQARGGTGSLSERLDVSLNQDGTIKPEAIESVPIAAVAEQDTDSSSDKVIPTRGQLDKLEEIAPRANRFTMRLGDGESFDGNVVLSHGETIVARSTRRSDNTTVLHLDTAFSGDRIHEHRTYQDCRTMSSDGIALIPNSADDPIPGTVRVYLNGIMMRRSSFVERVDPATKRISGVQISERPETIDLTEDALWFEYAVRPERSSSSSQEALVATRLSVFDHDVTASDLTGVYLPLNDSAGTLYRYWMIKIPDDVSLPYEGLQLYVSEDAYPHLGPIKGLTMRRYGQDWDVATLSGVRYVRWRYDQAAPEGGPTSGSAGYDFLAKFGSSGSPSSPNERYAVAPLSVGVRMSLFY